MKKVVNCAHRGASGRAPENTMKAFRLAIESGADMIELDARLTRDGAAVINHDADFKRTAKVSRAIRRMTLDEVRSIRFQGEPIPTLEEAIILCRDGGISINIECKTFRAVDEAVRLLGEHGMRDRAMISQFNAAALARAAVLDRGVETGYLTVPVLQPLPLLTARALGCAWINPNERQINPRFVALAHRLGLKVIPWTIDDPDIMRAFIEIGVDGFITNRPDLLDEIKKNMGVA